MDDSEEFDESDPDRLWKDACAAIWDWDSFQRNNLEWMKKEPAEYTAKEQKLRDRLDLCVRDLIVSGRILGLDVRGIEKFDSGPDGIGFEIKRGHLQNFLEKYKNRLEADRISPELEPDTADYPNPNAILLPERTPSQTYTRLPDSSVAEIRLNSVDDFIEEYGPHEKWDVRIWLMLFLFFTFWGVKDDRASLQKWVWARENLRRKLRELRVEARSWGLKTTELDALLRVEGPPRAPLGMEERMLYHDFQHFWFDYVDGLLARQKRQEQERAEQATARSRQGAPAKRKVKRQPRRSNPTDKQLEILKVVGECGHNFAEAARRLKLDRKTVKQHFEAGLRNAGKLASKFIGKPEIKSAPVDSRGQLTAASDDEGPAASDFKPKHGITRKSQ